MAKIVKTATGTAKNAHGKPIKDYGIKDAAGNVIRKVGYKFDWQVYPTEQDMLDANDGLSLKEQLKVRNDAAKTTARQAANAAAILAAGIVEPNAENDSQVRLKEVYSGIYGKLRASGKSHEEAHPMAREKAAAFLEEEWEDEGDEE
jgi:hypothetical protein